MLNIVKDYFYSFSSTERTSTVLTPPEWIDWAFSPGRPRVALAVSSILFKYYIEMPSRNFPRALWEKKNHTAVLEVQEENSVIDMLIKRFLVDNIFF